MVNYNVTGCIQAIKAREIAAAVKRQVPGAVIRFSQYRNNRSAHRGHSGNLDDSCARREWGWKPDQGTVDLIVGTFIKNMKMNPERYGL